MVFGAQTTKAHELAKSARAVPAVQWKYASNVLLCSATSALSSSSSSSKGATRREQTASDQIQFEFQFQTPSSPQFVRRFQLHCIAFRIGLPVESPTPLVHCRLACVHYPAIIAGRPAPIATPNRRHLDPRCRYLYHVFIYTFIDITLITQLLTLLL